MRSSDVASKNATAFIDDYFNFIRRYNLPPSYNNQVLLLMLQAEKIKKEYALMLINELAEYIKQSEPAITSQVVVLVY